MFRTFFPFAFPFLYYHDFLRFDNFLLFKKKKKTEKKFPTVWR